MAKKYRKFPPPEPDAGHPSRDLTHRFAVDTLLRESGFRIALRDGGEPVWVRHGVYFPETLALRTLDQGKVADAEYMEFLYWEGFRE